MLQHSNIATKHMTESTGDAWQKMNTTHQAQTSMAKVQKISGSQTWWNYWTWQKTASGSNVQSTKSTCYRNLTWQNKAWQYSTKCIWQKSLTDHKPKRTRRYDGNHVNIGSFVNRFQTWQKTEHGRNNNMKASWWAWCTHQKESMTKHYQIIDRSAFLQYMKNM